MCILKCDPAGPHRVNGERRLRFTGFAETLEATDAFANGLPQTPDPQP